MSEAKRTVAMGVDFGTASVRVVLVSLDGDEVASGVAEYPSGIEGVVGDPGEPGLARQNPADYLESLAKATRACAPEAFSVIGIGIGATSSTVLPLAQGTSPLSQSRPGDLDAMAWLWKDRVGHLEADEITDTVARLGLPYLSRGGSAHPPEWFWAKALHVARHRPDLAAQTETWAELADWAVASLTERSEIPRSHLLSGHKAMEHPEWGGFPPSEFLGRLHPELARWRDSLPTAVPLGPPAGLLSEGWARVLGLTSGTPVAAGAIDAHCCCIGAGVRAGMLVKVMGTSCFDMLALDQDVPFSATDALHGIVHNELWPGLPTLETSHWAFGDLFRWFAREFGEDQDMLDLQAAELRPGASGLLGLDWHQGNRAVYADSQLSGLLMGQSLATTRAEVYRAWLEAAALGARASLAKMRSTGADARELILSGGVPKRSRFIAQLFCDVLGLPTRVASSDQPGAVGAAVLGAVAAGRFPSFEAAQSDMVRFGQEVLRPDPVAQQVYDELHEIAQGLRRVFAEPDGAPVHDAMKRLIDLRSVARQEPGRHV